VRVRRLDATCEQDVAPLEGSVDTIVCLNVLEHIEDDRRALENFRRMLAVGGKLVLLVPARMSLFCDMDRHLGHFRRYEQGPLLQLVRQAGFEVTCLERLNWVASLGWWFNGKVLRKRKLPRGQVRLFDRALQWVLEFDPLLTKFGYLSLLVVGRRPA